MMGKDQIFSFFNDKRVTSVHKKPIDTILSGKKSFSLNYTVSGQSSELTSPKKNHNSITATEYSRNFENQSEEYSKEVISLC